MKAVMLVGLAWCAVACGSTAFVPPPPSPQRVYGAGEVDEPAEIVLTPPLHYPDGGSDGVVVVRVVIDSAGNPEPGTVHVIAGSDSALVAAARALVLKTLFRPARVRGRVVQALIDVPVEFSIASQPPVTLHVLGDVYAMDDIEERPHLTSSPPLRYPAPLLLSRVSGRVVIEAVIDTTGRAQEETVRVVESSDARFNEAARDYVVAARFSPGRVAGRAVRVRLQMPVEFKLPTRD
jgi:TonB family protein